MPEVVALAATENVGITTCDMCAYGFGAEDKIGIAPAEKQTRFLSNAPGVLKRISRQCSNKTSGSLVATISSGIKLSTKEFLDILPQGLPGSIFFCGSHHDGAIIDAARDNHRYAGLMRGNAKQCQA